MKQWYIITEVCEKSCEFVAISQHSLTLILKYDGVRVKIKMHDFADYRRAVNDEEISAIAVSPKGKAFNKVIKIVFK